jgi:hypothetical protein
MSACAAGCWLAALQLAPAALQLIEGAGVGAAKLAQSGDSPKLGMIELRRNASGAPEYRDMGLDRSSEDLKWVPITDATTDTQGWRPAVNFTNMEFQPRLAPAIPSRGDRYLAYAPHSPKTQAEQQGHESFGDCFGEPVGTFRWNGRLYDYWLPDELPRVREQI